MFPDYVWRFFDITLANGFAIPGLFPDSFCSLGIAHLDDLRVSNSFPRSGSVCLSFVLQAFLVVRSNMFPGMFPDYPGRCFLRSSLSLPIYIYICMYTYIYIYIYIYVCVCVCACACLCIAFVILLGWCGVVRGVQVR